MPIIDIFSYVALAYLAIATVDKFYNKRPSWQDSIYMLVLLGIAGTVFIFTKDMTIAIVKNNVANFIFSNQTGYTAHLMYCLLIVATTGIAWHGLLKYIVKPSSRGSEFVLAIASAMIGLSYLSSALNGLATKYNISNTDHFLYFCVALIIILSAIALYFFRKEIQEVVAIVLGGTIVYGVYVYAYFQYTGINLLDNARTAGHAGGGAFITALLAVLYAVVWYRKKAWYERKSYKIMAFFAMIAMLWSTYLSLAYIGGAIDKYEWEATQTENLAMQALDERQAKKLAIIAINGYTRDQALAVIKNPRSSDKEVANALQSIEKRQELQSKRVATKATPKSTINEERVKQGFSWIRKGVVWIWNNRFWNNNPQQKKGNQKKIAKTYTFTGIGYTGGVDGKGGVKTIKNFVHVQPGQKVQISSNAEVWDRGIYKKITSINNRSRKHAFFWMRAPHGEKIVVTIR